MVPPDDPSPDARPGNPGRRITRQSSHHNAPNKGQSGPFGLLYIWPSTPVGHAIATPCRMLCPMHCLGAIHLHSTTRPSAANMTAWRVVNKAGRWTDPVWAGGMGAGMGNRPASPLFARRRRPWKHHGTRSVSRSIERHSMRVHLKPVEDQIIVITGATSG